MCQIYIVRLKQLQPQYVNNPFYTDIGDFECGTTTEMNIMATTAAANIHANNHKTTMESIITNATSTAIDISRYAPQLRKFTLCNVKLVPIHTLHDTPLALYDFSFMHSVSAISHICIFIDVYYIYIDVPHIVHFIYISVDQRTWNTIGSGTIATIDGTIPINSNNPFLSECTKRDEFQKSPMKICLVVSPPSNKLLQVR